MITVGSLFSGIGGIELGLERTGGFRTVWFVEKDPYCQAVLRKHWPSIPICGDIREVDFNRVERPNMLTGGFPCQPLSVAGKRKGKEDERWLWPDYAQTVRILRPRIIFVENVPNLTAFNEEFGQILSDLAACGYDAEWNCVRASDVGAPHRRERIFIIGYNTHADGCSWRPAKQKIQTQDSDISRISESASLAYSNEYGRRGLPNQNEGERLGDRSRLEVEQPSQDMAHTNTHGFQGKNLHIRQRRQNETPPFTQRLSENVSDSDNSTTTRQRINRGQIFANSESTRLGLSRSAEWWAVESSVGRVAHGIPARVDRLRCLGNAVVPQVAQAIGEMILEAFA